MTVAACAFVPAAAQAREAVVRSFDGTPIVLTFEPAGGLPPGARAPTVLVGHGFAGNRLISRTSDDITGTTGADDLRAAGYNTLTWDARGFGQSGGRVELDNPDFEGRDVMALIDFVARQPEALLDGPQDPRVGMAGASYGGGIQLAAAAIDHRIDAIAPDIAWNSVVASLYKDETLKTVIAGVLSAAGVASSTVPGLVSPAGPQPGTVNPLITSALIHGATTGALSSDEVGFLAKAGAGDRLADVRAPTLLTQGTVDPIFSPTEALRNQAVLKRNGVPTKMIWFCGGHAPCLGDNGPPAHVLEAVKTWFARYLKRDRTIGTGAPFEWIADNERSFRTAQAFPLPERGRLTGTASGRLALSPLSDVGASGVGALATPALAPVIDVDLPAPAAPADVLGEPRVSLTYSGSGTTATAKLFAQVVDRATGRVVGNQVTPIPVTLDGKVRTVQRPLEAIATRATPGSRYTVQIIPATLVYARAQKGVGSIDVRRAEATLPIVDSAARPRLVLGAPTGLRSADRRHPVRARLRAVLDGYRDVRAQLLLRTGPRGSRRWPRVGASRAATVGTAGRRLAIRVGRRLRPGVYRVRATGADAYGRPVVVRRGVRLRTRR